MADKVEVGRVRPWNLTQPLLYMALIGVNIWYLCFSNVWTVEKAFLSLSTSLPHPHWCGYFSACLYFKLVLFKGKIKILTLQDAQLIKHLDISLPRKIEKPFQSTVSLVFLSAEYHIIFWICSVLSFRPLFNSFSSAQLQEISYY